MQARDGFALIAAIDWTPVLVALITLVSSLGVAALNVWVVLQLRTPSGRRIGAQVEDAHHVALSNNYRIQALALALGEPGEPDVPGARKREAPSVE